MRYHLILAKIKQIISNMIQPISKIENGYIMNICEDLRVTLQEFNDILQTAFSFQNVTTYKKNIFC